MKITYDKNADAMLILWNEKAEYQANKKLTEGYEFMLIMDKDNNPMGLEILHASDYVTHLEKIDYEDITRVEAEK